MAPRANMNGHDHPTPHPQNHQPPPQQPQPQSQPPLPIRLPNNHHYYPPRSSSSSASLKGCCCWLFLLFSFLLLLTLAIILVIFLAVKPKKPQFDLQQVAVQYVGITPNPPSPSTTTITDPTIATPTSSASVSLSIRMLFTAANDNKVGIKYGESRFTVMYRGIPLGKGTVPGFFQAAHSVRQVETTVAVDRVNLMQADAADLVRDASVNDRVELRVLGDVGAKIRILGVTSPGVQVHPRCEPAAPTTFSGALPRPPVRSRSAPPPLSDTSNPKEVIPAKRPPHFVSVDCAIVISPRKQALTYKQCGFDGLSV